MYFLDRSNKPGRPTSSLSARSWSKALLQTTSRASAHGTPTRRSAWTRRSLEATNFKTSWCDSRRQFVTGELLAPLSPRDIWILSRAVLYMKQLNRLDPDHELADPTGDRYYRHVLDWLREPTDEGYPHWEHTSRADEASYLAEHGESSEGGNYTSDEDE